jgi:hypothetical protein
MSGNQNVALVLEIYAAFGRGDIPAVIDVLDPKIDWYFYGPSTIPWAGHHHGQEGAAKFFSIVGSEAEFLEFTPLEFISEGDQVVVLGREQVKVKSTGRIFVSEWVHVFTIAGGRVTQIREIVNSAPIVEAFQGS